MTKISSIKGVKDILPGDVEVWQYIEKVSRKIFEGFGFSEIKIPIFESTELFSRSIGENTDIVEKEMYTFEDRDGKRITLRPEGTASVVRSYIEHHLYIKQPVTKLYYIGPMFRHERPQSGRFRQFYQIGGEAIGVSSPYIDVEILFMLYHLFNSLKIEEIAIEMNSIGCKICRPYYRERLKDFIKDRLDSLCESCRRRYYTNPIRILDCKREGCILVTNDAPSPIDHLCEECSAHFERVKEGVSDLTIPIDINKRLVRGLDYYTKTTFEIISNRLGAQNAVAAGGRYDLLVEELGGPSTPAIGFAIGIERVSYLIDRGMIPLPMVDLYIAILGQEARKRVFPIFIKLQERGIRVEIDYDEGSSLRSQMRKGNKSGAPFVLIIGEDELREGSVILRDMLASCQEKIPFSNLVDRIIDRVQRYNS